MGRKTRKVLRMAIQEFIFFVSSDFLSMDVPRGLSSVGCKHEANIWRFPTPPSQRSAEGRVKMEEEDVLLLLKAGSPLSVVNTRAGGKLVRRLFFVDPDLWAWCSLVPSTRRRDHEGACDRIVGLAWRSWPHHSCD